METPNVNDSKAEAHIEISTTLLETPYEESDLNQTEHDFLHQNEIINQELKRYDSSLNTCLLCLFRVWMALYITIFGIYDILYIISYYLNFRHKTVSDCVFAVIHLIEIVLMAASVYGYVLLWRGLSSKDVFKVERSITFFKIYLAWDAFLNLYSLAGDLYHGTYAWDNYLICFAELMMQAASIGIALYVKKVILKRDVFQKVISITPTPSP